MFQRGLKRRLDACRREVKNDPKHAGSWHNLGFNLGELDRHDEAVDAYRRAVEIDPNFAVAWFNLGFSLGRLSRHEEAVDAYRRAIEIDPKYAMAWRNLGLNHRRLGRHEEAVEAYRRAVEIDPDFAVAWFNLGFSLGRLDRHEEAVDAYRRAVEIDPRDVRAQQVLNLALRRIQERSIDQPLVETPIQVTRGCAAVGGKFEYKVKVKNNTSSVITNVTITILTYPDDCMNISGPPMKTLKRLGIGEFRSPQFIFVPTKDCVEGRIIATVSYMDSQDQAHTHKVEPYIIRSVCDLLEPLESSLEEFELMLADMSVNSEEISVSQQPETTFEQVQELLPDRNFHIIAAERESDGGEFRGTAMGLALGKYTGKKVAIRITISGLSESNTSGVRIEALGTDPDMLPTTIEEIVRELRT